MRDVKVERVDVWVAGLRDEPGALAETLSALHDGGADLDFIIARRSDQDPGAVVFLTPLTSDAEVDAAARLGFTATNHLHSVRVEGDNQAGVAARITKQLAQEGFNLRGFSGAVLGERYILYIGFDSAADADRAVAVLRDPD
ncbi:MAG: amino acid-binding protein, partial [Armatimonadetes bacterium]|nr:amino acid-binding protein [Armatimonadota bacterium]